MALITSLGLFFLSVFVATLSRFFAAEIEAWVPSFVGAILKLAVSRLPGRHRGRFDEEWRSHINDVPGTLGKFVTATGFFFAAYKIASAERTIEPLRIALLRADIDATVGQALVATVGKVEGGAPPYSLKVADGTQLPQGVSLTIDAEGNISFVGTPKTAGALAVTVRVTDSSFSIRDLIKIPSGNRMTGDYFALVRKAFYRFVVHVSKLLGGMLSL